MTAAAAVFACVVNAGIMAVVVLVVGTAWRVHCQMTTPDDYDPLTARLASPRLWAWCLAAAGLLVTWSRGSDLTAGEALCLLGITASASAWRFSLLMRALKERDRALPNHERISQKA